MSESKINSRLVLGTVQLGMPYGVANKTGQPDREKAAAIIKQAWDSGIVEFDTAQGYGNSESVLGEIFAQLGIADKVRVISKFHPQLDHLNKEVLSRALDESLSKLRLSSIDGILLHHENLFDRWNEGVGDNLKDLVKNGKVRKIGVSVYSVATAKTALATPGINLIQLPANVFDHRFEAAGFFEEAQKRNIEVYIRSVFLQGLLLMPPGEVPVHLAGAKSYLEQWARLCEESHVTRRELAMGYIGSQMTQTKIVFGVETVEQLKENIRAWGKDYPETINERVRQQFSAVPEKIINPTLWKE